MFWSFLAKFAFFLFKMFVPPSTAYAMQETRRNPNAPCPSCGHRSGYLKTVRPKGEMTGEGLAVTACKVLHICRVCDAKWHENTIVLDKTADTIFPADSYMYLQPTETK